jgi:hypothetical protein
MNYIGVHKKISLFSLLAMVIVNCPIRGDDSSSKQPVRIGATVADKHQ